jgi:hypothetical protein
MASNVSESADRGVVNEPSLDTGRAEPADPGQSATYWVEALVYTSMCLEATAVLRHMHRAAVPALLQGLKHGNNRVREEAALVLRQIDAEAAPAVGVN